MSSSASPPDAEPQQITRAFRRLIRTLHPDAAPEAQTAGSQITRERFDQVVAAYRILHDPASAVTPRPGPAHRTYVRAPMAHRTLRLSVSAPPIQALVSRNRPAWLVGSAAVCPSRPSPKPSSQSRTHMSVVPNHS